MSTPQVYTVKHTLFSPNPITWNDAVKGPRKLAIFSVSTAKVTLATLVTNIYFVAARYLKIGISSTRPPSTTGSWPLSTSHYRWWNWLLKIFFRNTLERNHLVDSGSFEIQEPDTLRKNPTVLHCTARFNSKYTRELKAKITKWW